MRLSFAAVVFLFAMFFGAGPQRLGAEVDFQVSYEYYPVRYVKGMTVSDMIVKDTPLRDANGVHRHVGQASWRIRYPQVTFTRPLIDVCLIDNPGVLVTCTIRLAKLEGGDEAARAAFETRVAKTLKHEMAHCNIAQAHARKLEERFLKIGKKPCKKIRQVMRSEFDAVYADCRREQKQFDVNEYGHRQYLRLETLQSMVDSGADVLPPKEGYRIPRLDKKKRKLEVLDQDPEKLTEEGFYKDENGVWRNF